MASLVVNVSGSGWFTVGLSRSVFQNVLGLPGRTLLYRVDAVTPLSRHMHVDDHSHGARFMDAFYCRSTWRIKPGAWWIRVVPQNESVTSFVVVSSAFVGVHVARRMWAHEMELVVGPWNVLL
jgi:hypothetical protein